METGRLIETRNRWLGGQWYEYLPGHHSGVDMYILWFPGFFALPVKGHYELQAVGRRTA
jgi:hypothetical protein